MTFDPGIILFLRAVDFMDNYGNRLQDVVFEDCRREYDGTLLCVDLRCSLSSTMMFGEKLKTFACKRFGCK